ncbi:MAG TPA: NADH-quinone oxidoreductase subunit C [Oculatellaceae cyanobacterium]
MRLEPRKIELERLANATKVWLETKNAARLGLVTSIDGGQLCTLVLDPVNGAAECWLSPLDSDCYKSLTPLVPQAHWFERILWDMFGIVPEGHPRLKHVVLHDSYDADFFPLRKVPLKSARHAGERRFHFLEVRGEGVYEIPVGPIHSGVAEPGHFRFSCFGETILNLELQLGYVHRGVEQRLTEVPWKKARFVAEAAASDSSAANALAHAVAIESLMDIQVSPLAEHVRTLALELERVSTHIFDLAEIGKALGFSGFYQNLARLREKPLELAQSLCGSRYMRGLILSGGIQKIQDGSLSQIRREIRTLRDDLKSPIGLLQESQAAVERMEVSGITRSLAHEFGMVGLAARSSGIDYDCRRHFSHGCYPQLAPHTVVELGGDVMARVKVRVGELSTSFDVIESVLETIPGGDLLVSIPENLPANAFSCGVVEAARGELIHMIATGDDGRIRRYSIKDPSQNNWTAVSIGIRNNLVADFPLSNKSLSLSLSGNDL